MQYFQDLYTKLDVGLIKQGLYHNIICNKFEKKIQDW